MHESVGRELEPGDGCGSFACAGGEASSSQRRFVQPMFSVANVVPPASCGFFCTFTRIVCIWAALSCSAVLLPVPVLRSAMQSAACKLRGVLSPHSGPCLELMRAWKPSCVLRSLA
eukprot:3163949-Prymnesium_polylepis.1